MTANAGDVAPTQQELTQLRAGLSLPLPELAPRYLYDDVGSALFEQITELDEYYPTRTELLILERDAAALMQAAQVQRLVELGSGAGRKIRTLLQHWPQRDGGRCTMLDVNARFLEDSVHALSSDFAGCLFDGVVGDFTKDLALLDETTPHRPSRLTVFFAGTIGNLTPTERHTFFTHFARTMTDGDSLLVGADLVKDRARIEAAYNDRAGVTAAFNKNALNVVNARFGANFDLNAFEHHAFFSVEHQWIEMRLRATHATSAHVKAIGLDLALAKGQEIRTEISCKFTRETFEGAASKAGLKVRSWHSDPEGLFALAHLWKAHRS